jgi:sulfite reductase alpha subunit-like flavoprotein
MVTEVLDVFGKPPRRFYETLSIAAKDDAEAKEIEFLQSKEGKDKFQVTRQQSIDSILSILSAIRLRVARVKGNETLHSIRAPWP